MNKNVLLIFLAVAVLIISAVLLLSKITITQSGVVYALPFHSAAYESNLILTPQSMGNYRLQQPDNLIPFHQDRSIRRGDLEYRHFDSDRLGFFTSNGRITGFYVSNPDYVFLNAISLGVHQNEVEQIIGQPADIFFDDTVLIAEYARDNLIIEYIDFEVSAIVIHQNFKSIEDYRDFYYSITTSDMNLKAGTELNVSNLSNPDELPVPRLQYIVKNEKIHTAIATEAGIFNSIVVEIQKEGRTYSYKRSIQPGFSSIVFSIPGSAESTIDVSLSRIVGKGLSFTTTIPSDALNRQ